MATLPKVNTTSRRNALSHRQISLCSVAFILTSGVCVTASEPTGMFQTTCLQRHFMLSVDSSLLGPVTRFDFEDQYGLHVLSSHEATLCGYTVLAGDGGDLVLRASFQACHVYSKGGADLHLRLWLVNLQADGNVTAQPLRLHCSVQGRRSAREIICEENYMEVSLQRPVVPFASQNRKQGADWADMAVTFHGDGRPAKERGRVLSRAEAAAAGYHVSARGSRLTLRCPYSSPHSYFVEEKGVVLEVVRATILHRLWRSFVAVDAAVACALNEATADGSDLVWAVPLILPPLVHGRFRDRGWRVGVSGRPLSDSERGVEIGLREGRLEVRVPFGVTGGRIKSGAVRGQYSRSMTVDLFLVRRWADERWPLTQHRSLRRLTTPLIPQIPVFARNPVPSEGLFSATLGVFAADASLRKVTVDGGGDLLTWTRDASSVTGLGVSHLPDSDGSHSYRIVFPLSHPKIIPQYIGGGFETYSLAFTFVIGIHPNGEAIYHQATIEHSVAYAAPSSPKLEGKCTESGLLVLLHHGAQSELQWEVFLGGRRLDWDLVEMGGFVVEAEEDYLTVEIPSHSPGINYMVLTLQGLVSGVDVSVVDAESLRVEDRLVHKCTFPVRELLACLPEGRMVAVVDTTHTVPPTHPDQTTLLDPSCVPMETDSSRALFSFSLDSCGTTVTNEGDFLVYENQISSAQDFLPLGDPLIHRAPAYRLTIQCRYPANDTRTLSVHHPLNSSRDLSPTPVRRIRREAANTGQRNWRVNFERRRNHHLVPAWITWTLVCLLLLLAFCTGISAHLTCN